MNNIDTNINNYSLDDMVNLFKTSKSLLPEHISHINSIISVINGSIDNIEPDIIILFKKVYTILVCLHKYRHHMRIKFPTYNYTLELDDYRLINNVKKINNYENYNDVSQLINHFIDDHEKLINKEINNPHPIVEDETIIINPINTFNNKVISGSINAIKRITKRTNIHINSCFREKYYQTNPCDFIYTLPKQFKNVISLKLVSIDFPSNCLYLFSSFKNNNVFYIKIGQGDNDFSYTLYTIIVPDGNYCNDSLFNYLNITYFDQSNTTTNLKYLHIYLSHIDNKTRIVINDAGIANNILFSLIIVNNETDNIMETCGWILGFRLIKYCNISNCIISEGLYNNASEQYVYFVLNDYQYNYNESNLICFDKSSVEGFTLAKIPFINNKCVLFASNDYSSLLKERQYNGPINLTKFEIKIIDMFGDIIDINNMDFGFSLEIEVLYERNNIV